MKIRTVEPHMRIGITLCEECKERKTDGVFLQLGFFNGFICKECGCELGKLLNDNDMIQKTIITETIIVPPTGTAEATAQAMKYIDYEPVVEKYLTENTWPGMPEAGSGQFAIGMEQYDAPTSHQDAPRTILGEEVTQDIYDALETRCNALESKYGELLRFKMEIGVNWMRFIDNINESIDYAKRVEENLKA